MNELSHAFNAPQKTGITRTKAARFTAGAPSVSASQRAGRAPIAENHPWRQRSNKERPEAPMANLITTSRLALLCLLIWLGYEASPQWQLLSAPLLLLIFILDGVDGYVARRRGEDSLFGSVYDIAADRIVENALWLQLADLDLVPVWVALLFIVRGILVDSIRGLATARGQRPFSLTASALGNFLVAGRFMRGAYGTIKAITFGWILLLQPWPALIPDFWARWAPVLNVVTTLLIGLAVAMCLLRAAPVLLTVLPRARREALRGTGA